MTGELSASEVLLALMKEKLPGKYRRKWEEIVTRGSHENSLKGFFEYFEAELTVDDAMSADEDFDSDECSVDGSTYHQSGHRMQTTQGLHTRTQQPLRSCLYCAGAPHDDVSECAKLHQMPLEKRWEAVTPDPCHLRASRLAVGCRNGHGIGVSSKA